jgi:hypothetical protein
MHLLSGFRGNTLHIRTLFGFLFLLSLIALPGCATNNSTALYRYNGSSYVVELTGRRNKMTHDPISALFAGTMNTNLLLFLPRLEGTVPGNELLVDGRRNMYSGQVSFDGSSMTVDLHYENPVVHRRDALSFNGRYRLRPQPQ